MTAIEHELQIPQGEQVLDTAESRAAREESRERARDAARNIFNLRLADAAVARIIFGSKLESQQIDFEAQLTDFVENTIHDTLKVPGYDLFRFSGVPQDKEDLTSEANSEAYRTSVREFSNRYVKTELFKKEKELFTDHTFVSGLVSTIERQRDENRAMEQQVFIMRTQQRFARESLRDILTPDQLAAYDEKIGFVPEPIPTSALPTSPFKPEYERQDSGVLKAIEAEANTDDKLAILSEKIKNFHPGWLESLSRAAAFLTGAPKTKPPQSAEVVVVDERLSI